MISVSCERNNCRDFYTFYFIRSVCTNVLKHPALSPYEERHKKLSYQSVTASKSTISILILLLGIIVSFAKPMLEKYDKSTKLFKYASLKT